MATPNAIWIWRLANLQKDHMDILQSIGCSRVYIKILDDNSSPVLWTQCSEDTIKTFSDAGIEVWVWGLHDAAKDYTAEVKAIDEGFERGIVGYVFDIEPEAEKKSEHNTSRAC